ncbi:hypothetical protein HAZT_HAZT004566 [Hyalella azteca]|uniref:Uncharacterized protein n=1 Tax=Hyalella azteca TaxID=294128 RepID=A0A6A0HDC5_HYAAZ|nr:hypothetical protein HAZT_HAZT004566 [Hyalella azteca]
MSCPSVHSLHHDTCTTEGLTDHAAPGADLGQNPGSRSDSERRRCVMRSEQATRQVWKTSPYPQTEALPLIPRAALRGEKVEHRTTATDLRTVQLVRFRSPQRGTFGEKGSSVILCEKDLLRLILKVHDRQSEDNSNTDHLMRYKRYAEVEESETLLTSEDSASPVISTDIEKSGSYGAEGYGGYDDPGVIVVPHEDYDTSYPYLLKFLAALSIATWVFLGLLAAQTLAALILLAGPKGAKGDKGPKGIKGMKGDKGMKGIKGMKGDKGIKGVQGPSGAIGDTGEAGETGEAGVIGDTGPKGFKGPIGTMGTKGTKGPKGAKGDKGDKGAKGLKGMSPRHSCILSRQHLELTCVPVRVSNSTAPGTLLFTPSLNAR